MDHNYIFLWVPVVAIFSAAGLIAYIITHVTHKEMPKGEMGHGSTIEGIKTVTLTQARYEELLNNERMLEALNQSGVDNWTDYGEAQDLYHEWSKDDDTQSVPE